ncbi:Hypothetical protein CINCED_3A007191 [Cinara cedri]|uniref:Peptidase S1 domain-containing protein n=1 Tax=Cinara cedri TaxID=506608 RepID=A0A5E4ML74_9HEMI|nr:Hypothetical protein CINCED_3A007191 [Cinara cedri]
MVLFQSIVIIGTLSTIFGYENLYYDLFPDPPSTTVGDEVTVKSTNTTTVWTSDEGFYDRMEEEVEQECLCKPYYDCATFVSTSDGAGFINIRMPLGQCESYLDVCCKNQTKTEKPISSTPHYNNTDGSYIHHGQKLETAISDKQMLSPTTEFTPSTENNDVTYSTVSATDIAGNTQKPLKNVLIEQISTVTNHLTQLFRPENHSVSTESTETIKFHQNPSNQNSSETTNELVGNTESSIFPIKTEETVVSSIDSQSVHKCGTWNKYGVGFRIFNDIDGESQYSEYPSMVAIFEQDLKSPERKLVLKCGGSLIKPNVVLTAAHCVIKSNHSKFIIRAGDWDLKTERELYPTQEVRVSKIVTHKEYYSGGLFNDIALIFTEKNFILEENVQIMCLPEENDSFADSRCFSTGWGKTVSYNNYSIVRKTESGNIHKSGQYEVSILKKVELPIVARDQCQKALKTTRLGPEFILHESFLCAGGEKGIDTCKVRHYFYIFFFFSIQSVDWSTINVLSMILCLVLCL